MGCVDKTLLFLTVKVIKSNKKLNIYVIMAKFRTKLIFLLIEIYTKTKLTWVMKII